MTSISHSSSASLRRLERSLYDCISERVSVSRAAVIMGEVDMRRGEFADSMAELMLNDLQLCLERGDVGFQTLQRVTLIDISLPRLMRRRASR